MNVEVLNKYFQEKGKSPRRCVARRLALIDKSIRGTKLAWIPNREKSVIQSIVEKAFKDNLDNSTLPHDVKKAFYDYFVDEIVEKWIYINHEVIPKVEKEIADNGGFAF